MYFVILGTMEEISYRTFCLAQHVRRSLAACRHANNTPVVRLYAETDFESKETQGPVVTFNLLNDRGEYVGYSQVGFLIELLQENTLTYTCIGLHIG